MKKIINLHDLFSDIFHRTGPSRVSRHQAMQKLRQLQQSIVNWDGHDLVANSSEIVWGKLLLYGLSGRTNYLLY